MSLSKKSIKKLRAVKAAILAEPELYDQGKFSAAVDPCGSACCIAGWAVWLDSPDEFRALAALGDRNWTHDFAKRIGVDYSQADRLTDPGQCWLPPFNADYATATSPLQRAKVAAARIEHFIATDGRE